MQSQEWGTTIGAFPAAGQRGTGSARRGDPRALCGTALLVSLSAAVVLAYAGPSEAAVEPRAAPVADLPLPTPSQEARDPAYEIEMLLTPPSDTGAKELLLRAGVTRADAQRAAQLLAESGVPGLSGGDSARLLLGGKSGSSRSLSGLTLTRQSGIELELVRSNGGDLKLTSRSTVLDATPRRFAGRVGSSLYWSLRAVGATAEVAGAYMEALQSRTELNRLDASDRFELVVEHLRTREGQAADGPLLYAALHRHGQPPVRLVRWTVGGLSGLYEPGRRHQRSEGLIRPVNGRLTSRFGYRVHPIIRIGRFHHGVDYGAAWGTPVFAAADGLVSAAGWNGGHGQQVRLAHANGLATSYSHLSRILASPSHRVARGDLIGFVGSTGFSTGAHLHFEVHVNGRAVDPLTVRHSGATMLSPQEVASLEARARQLASL